MSATGSACNWSTRTWSGGTSTSRGSIEVTPSIGIGSDGDAGAGRGKRMANKRKIALFAAGGLFALLLLAAVALLLLVDGNAHKPRLEGGAPPALPHKELRIGQIGMKRPRISIEQDPDGKFNFETTEEEAGKKTAEEAEGTRFSLDVTKISLSDGALFYADKKTGEELEAGDFHMDVSPLLFTGGKKSDLLQNLSFAAEFACKEFRKGSLAVSNLKLRIEGKDGLYGIRPVTADRLVYSGSGGKVTAVRLALGVENLAVGGDGKADLLRRISFSGTAGIGEVRTEDLVVSALKSAGAGEDGVLDLHPVTIGIFGGRGKGGLRAGLSGSAPLYHGRYSLSG